jgi:hypothetical protein
LDSSWFVLYRGVFFVLPWAERAEFTGAAAWYFFAGFLMQPLDFCLAESDF